MEEQKFKELYSKHLATVTGKWKFMNEKSMKEDFLCSVSAMSEINKDILFYYYKGNLYSLDLNKTNIAWGGALRLSFNICLTSKSNLVIKLPGNLVENTTLIYASAGKAFSFRHSSCLHC